MECICHLAIPASYHQRRSQALPQEALPDSRPGDVQHKEAIPGEVKHYKQTPLNALFTHQQEGIKSLRNLFD